MIALTDIPKLRHVEAKLGTMRKVRRWSPMRQRDGSIIVQGDGAIGIFDPTTGAGRLNVRGGYFPHLHAAMGARPFVFPPAFVAECVAACDHARQFEVEP